MSEWVGCMHLCTLPGKIKVVPMATTTCYVHNMHYWRGGGFMRGEPSLALALWGLPLLTAARPGWRAFPSLPRSYAALPNEHSLSLKACKNQPCVRNPKHPR